MKQMHFLFVAFSVIGLTSTWSNCSSALGQKEIPVSQPRLDQLDEIMKQAHEKQVQQHKYRSNSFTMNLLEAGLDNPKLFELMEFSSDQKKEIQKLVSSYQSKRRELTEKFKASDDVETLVRRKLLPIRSEYQEKVLSILVDFQLEDLAKMNILQVGVPHILVDSKIGEAMNLTERQKSRIKANSDRLAKKLENLIHESRQEAHAAVFSELDQGQKEFLFNLYGNKPMVNYFERIGLSTIFQHYRFFENDPPKYPVEPVLRTEIPALRR